MCICRDSGTYRCKVTQTNTSIDKFPSIYREMQKCAHNTSTNTFTHSYIGSHTDMHIYAYTKVQVCTFTSTCTEIVHKHTHMYNLRFSLYPSIPSLNSELLVLSTLNPFCKFLLAQGPSWPKAKGNNDIPSVTSGLLRPKIIDLRVGSPAFGF